LLICLALPAVLAAQAQPTVAEHIALGDSAHAALAPQQALGHYRAALAHDSTNYAALWKAGREAVDIAKQIEGKDDSSKQVRDSLYVVARAYGEAAVRVNPNGADGHFTVGQALGRLSRTKGGKERVRFAKLIYDEGMKALELELPEVYVDLGKYSKAREQFTAIDPLPIADVLDHEYKQEAKQILADIKGEKDET